MSVETRGRQAAEGLRGATVFDVESGLVRMRRTRRRRDLARLATAAVVVAAAVGGMLAVSERDAAIEPVGPMHNGRIVPPQQGQAAWEDFDQSTGSFLYYTPPPDDLSPSPGVFRVVGNDGELGHFACPFPDGCDGLDALGPGPQEVTLVDRRSSQLHVVEYDGATRDTIDLRDAVGGDLLTEMAWSPDGTRLAVSTWCEQPSSGCQPGVWVVDRDGSNPELVLSDPAPTSGIAWAPDGSQLAVSADCEVPPFAACPARVWLVDPHGATPDVVYSERPPRTKPGEVSLSPLVRELAWSPDGHSLAFIRHTDACGAAIDAGVRPRLTAVGIRQGRATRPHTLHVYDDIDCHGDLLPHHYPRHFNYTWSPDGTRLAVTTGVGFDEISAADGHVLAKHSRYQTPGLDFVTGPLAWLRAP
jgi:dipeptidyl aminopeptidase/acylaminoacyl peptidase